MTNLRRTSRELIGITVSRLSPLTATFQIWLSGNARVADEGDFSPVSQIIVKKKGVKDNAKHQHQYAAAGGKKSLFDGPDVDFDWLQQP